MSDVAESAGPGLTGLEGRPGISRVPRQERLELLRRRIAAIAVRGESVDTRMSVVGTCESVEPRLSWGSPVESVAGLLPVPAPLADLLPRGGVVRGSVVSVSGATSLLLALLASVTTAGGHAVVIGQPRLGLLAATEMGVQLRRLALIPDPGPDPVQVAAVLLDGVDLVVLGLGGASVTPSRARAVVARARNKGSTLVVTDGHWDGADIRLDARVCGYGGFGRGAEAGRGLLRSLRFSVRAQGRSFQPRTTWMDLRSVSGRVEWVAENREQAASGALAL